MAGKGGLKRYSAVRQSRPHVLSMYLSAADILIQSGHFTSDIDPITENDLVVLFFEHMVRIWAYVLTAPIAKVAIKKEYRLSAEK